MNTIKVKNVSIGEGSPKICVPLVGHTLSQLLEEAERLRTVNLDLVEWRVDFFEHVTDLEKVTDAITELRDILEDIPLIFTFRSAKEGGEKEVSANYYMELNERIIETGLVDIIDVELFSEEEQIKALIKKAHAHDVFVIVSNHDFERTPPKEEILARLRRAQELGGDFPKIAVMPTNAKDVLTLLEATLTMKEHYAKRPIITMSMGGKGMISRISGEIFGSAITFAAGQKASAPGQVNVNELYKILSLISKNL